MKHSGTHGFKSTLAGMIIGLLLSWPAHAADALVLLQYHHIDSNTPASTSVSPARFEQHLQLIEQLNIHVLPLDWALTRIAQDQPIPQPAVALTFDDAYRSVLTQARPRLRARNWPYTVFVAPKNLGSGSGSGLMLSWTELKQLRDEGVLIANHSLAHDYLIRQKPGESLASWRQRTLAELLQAQSLLEAALGPMPPWLAYPYGEYNLLLQDLLQSMGWLGFGQQSGPVSRYSDRQALPRFPVSGRFSNPAALRHKLLSLPMPVSQTRTDPATRGNAYWQVVLQQRPFAQNALTCFLPGNKQQRPRWSGPLRFSLQAPIPSGRSRFNCTAPGPGQDRFYWLSQPWISRNP